DDPARKAPESIIDHKLRLRDELLLVAVCEGVVAGAIMGGYDGFRGWLYYLAVVPEYRRRGCGTLLVHEGESRLRLRGCSKVNLQIRASNSRVAGFYAALGYSEEPRVSMGRAL